MNEDKTRGTRYKEQGRRSWRSISGSHFFLLCTLCFVFLTSCGPSGKSFRINGQFRDMQGGELYIYNLSASSPRLDTIQVKDGSFRYGGTIDQETPFILVFPNAMEHVIFVAPGQTLRYEATANDLKNYVVNGSDENKLMNKFRQDTYRADEAQTTRIAADYIKKHTQSLVAVYLFSRYFIQNPNAPLVEIQTLLKSLRAAHPENRTLLDAEGSLKIAGRGQVGSKLPNVTLTTKAGKKIQLSDVPSGGTLIGFWASWIPQQWKYNEQMRTAAEQAKNSRKDIRVVSVSIDTEIYKWESFIRTDTVNVQHVCDGRAWDTPLVAQLGIRQLPTYIIADANNQIIVRGTDLDQLPSDFEKNLIDGKKQ